jgi:hypothetical protein
MTAIGDTENTMDLWWVRVEHQNRLTGHLSAPRAQDRPPAGHGGLRLAVNAGLLLRVPPDQRREHEVAR